MLIKALVLYVFVLAFNVFLKLILPSFTFAHRCVCGGCRMIPEGRRSPPHTPPHSAAARRGQSSGSGRMIHRCHTACWQDR